MLYEANVYSKKDWQLLLILTLTHDGAVGARRTPVHFAAALNVPAGARLVAMLHSAGAAVNHRDVTGRTALMCVAMYVRQRRRVRRLISELTSTDSSSCDVSCDVSQSTNQRVSCSHGFLSCDC